VLNSRDCAEMEHIARFFFGVSGEFHGCISFSLGRSVCGSMSLPDVGGLV